jgi:hypothetical protein
VRRWRWPFERFWASTTQIFVHLGRETPQKRLRNVWRNGRVSAKVTASASPRCDQRSWGVALPSNQASRRSSPARAGCPQGRFPRRSTLKVINVSYIMIAVNRKQILYTNKTVRLHYRAPTMRNGSETVIRTIASGLCHVSDYTTSSNTHRPRSMTCVCFANPSSLGVTEPFLTQKLG